jgi:gluconolactonase
LKSRAGDEIARFPCPEPGKGSGQGDLDVIQPVRYPDPAVEALDPRFAPYKLGSAAVERLWTGSRWAEGPVYFGDGRYLLFSDIPNNQILRWDECSGAVSVFRQVSNNSNGNTRDRYGRLVTCEHDARRVTRTEYDGSISVLADSYQNKPLNAPNDVIAHSDGSLWFTDPGYGIQWEYEGHKATAELPNAVYRLSPEGTLSMLTDALHRPNGLCFSPDESKLYVADSGDPRDIRVFDITRKNTLAKNRRFADMKPGLADGIRCDVDGNLWSSAGWGGAGYDGVHIFAPDGALIGKVQLPEVCSNLCFGGRKKNRLFMTGSQSLYSLYTDAKGI